MPRALYDEIVVALAQVQTLERLGLSGPMGEPALVPDLAERAAFARRAGFSEVIMNTNGYALHRHDAGALLAGFTEICISLDAVDPELHASIHGKNGQLPKILENLDALMRHKREHGGARVHVRFTEQAKNRKHWPAFEAFMANRADGIIRKRIHSFMDVLPEHGADVGARLCNQPYRVINVDQRGRLSTCCVNWRADPRFGPVTSFEALKAAWESPAYEAWRDSRMEHTCKGCSGVGPAAQSVCGSVSRDLRKLQRIAAAGERAFYGGTA